MYFTRTSLLPFAPPLFLPFSIILCSKSIFFFHVIKRNIGEVKVNLILEWHLLTFHFLWGKPNLKAFKTLCLFIISYIYIYTHTHTQQPFKIQCTITIFLLKFLSNNLKSIGLHWFGNSFITHDCSNRLTYIGRGVHQILFY